MKVKKRLLYCHSPDWDQTVLTYKWEFEPVALSTQPLYSYATNLASSRLSLVHLIPWQRTVKDSAWSGTPLTLPPGFEPCLDQRLPVGSGHANHYNHLTTVYSLSRNTVHSRNQRWRTAETPVCVRIWKRIIEKAREKNIHVRGIGKKEKRYQSKPLCI